MKTIRRQARSGTLFSVLLAAALFMRILVPAGWMPVVDASGVHLEICSGWAKEPRPEPRHHHMAHASHHASAEKAPAHEHEPSKHSNQPCAFSGLGLAFLDAAHPPVIEPAPADAAPPGRVLLAVLGRGLAAPPPPSTGPPTAA